MKFGPMRVLGDAILVFGCVFGVMGIQIMARDPHLMQDIDYLLRTGELPMTAKLLTGSTWIFYGLLTAGFGQIVYAIAVMAGREPPSK